ncbi:DUF424 family protein [Candidatus Pacearchaeota archaeon]|nr:DUF424 family protein [Candidatus Pacearchaeota archaeon]
MWVKIHKSYRTIVAVCDEDLLGKKIEEGVKQLDVRENFYNGQKMSKEELIQLLRREAKEDAMFNIVGKESVETALESRIIEKNSWHKIKGIPYVLVLA